MVSTAAVVLTTIGAVLGLSGTFVGFYIVPKIAKILIEENLKLVEGSEAWERWRDVGIPMVHRYYFFNITNAEDVSKGAKPIVNEVGPYVYKQHKVKMDITRKEDILSYYQHELFEFDEKASAPLTANDSITIVNLPLMSIATVAEYNSWTSYYELGLLDSTIPTIFNNPSSIFLKTTPREFLFDGIDIMCNSSSFLDIIVCNIIEQYAPAMMPRLEDGRFRFSLFGYRNNTYTDYYSIISGLSDISRLGEIVAWDNSTVANAWRENSKCSQISGSDGAIFPPGRTPESLINHFNTDVCRTVRAEYSENITFAGVDAYRYIVTGKAFASPSNYSDNDCYCLNRTLGIRGSDGCMLDGALELWDCQGVPALISLPHFYQANEVYQNGVDGLKPNGTLHTMFLDLEPMTGVVLRGSKRAQVNIFIRKINGISVTENLPTVLMPVLWIDQSFELDDAYMNLLNTKLFDVLDLVEKLKWAVITCGMMLFISGLIWVVRSTWNPSQHTKLV